MVTATNRATSGRSGTGDWRDRARALKAADPERSNGSIARDLGVDPSQVWRLFNPEARRAQARRDNARRAAAKRVWENEHDRGTCACGGTLAVGARRKGLTRCDACFRAAQVAAREATEALLIRMWRDGATRRQIAVVTGDTPKTVSWRVAKLRAAGVDLPYRRTDAIEAGRRLGRGTAARAAASAAPAAGGRS